MGQSFLACHLRNLAPTPVYRIPEWGKSVMTDPRLIHPARTHAQRNRDRFRTFQQSLAG